MSFAQQSQAQVAAAQAAAAKEHAEALLHNERATCAIIVTAAQQERDRALAQAQRHYADFRRMIYIAAPGWLGCVVLALVIIFREVR